MNGGKSVPVFLTVKLTILPVLQGNFPFCSARQSRRRLPSPGTHPLWLIPQIILSDTQDTFASHTSTFTPFSYTDNPSYLHTTGKHAQPSHTQKLPSHPLSRLPTQTPSVCGSVSYELVATFDLGMTRAASATLVCSAWRSDDPIGRGTGPNGEWP